jgi:hypothetical protein
MGARQSPQKEAFRFPVLLTTTFPVLLSTRQDIPGYCVMSHSIV